MANLTDRQKKALGIFQFVLELLLGLFRAHHAKDLTPSTYPNEDMTTSDEDAE